MYFHSICVRTYNVCIDTNPLVRSRHVVPVELYGRNRKNEYDFILETRETLIRESEPGGSGCSRCASHWRGNRKSEQNSNVHRHKALLLSAKTADRVPRICGTLVSAVFVFQLIIWPEVLTVRSQQGWL